jgi:uncharacterized heparinase superfamily protein
MSLADSVYLGGGEVRRTRQIVLSARLGNKGTTVRWAIRRDTESPEGEGGEGLP